MTDPTAGFFLELGSRGHEPLLADVAAATVRFDITRARHTDRWFLGIDKGDLAVSTVDDAQADCVISADRVLFDGIATGAVNAMAALLRGELSFDGDPELLVLCQRLFPGPPAGDPSSVGTEGRRSA